jgi:peroxiredoxin
MSTNTPLHSWAPITDEDPTVCGRPQEIDASKEWKGKKVVLFSVPGSYSILESHTVKHPS